MDLGRGPAVTVEGAPRLSQMGVALGAQVVMGLAPATEHPKAPAENPERHIAVMMAVAAAVALPGVRTTTATTTETAAMTMPFASRGVAT